MENVVAFNNELSGLYESKPPISKAKMAAITRAAMKAIKFYKHVVQSVEKFILKCKPEYKVPGLYVIDSIVRQSRHQFGPEKDVFAPRFARNIKDTFANLFRCAPEDKSRIIRVLNLWQKNNVFAPDVIQPIFDLADPNHPIYSMPPNTGAGPSGLGGAAAGDISQANGLNTSGSSLDVSMGGGGSGPSAADDKMAGGSGGLADLSNNNLKQLLNDPNVLRQLQTLQNFNKFKQDDKQHNLRLQEEAFEKHLQNVLKSNSAGPSNQQESKEVEFVSEEMGIEVINLDGNDSRSPTPDRDRYNKRRRSRSRSRSRDRGGRRRRTRSRSRSRSPRSNRRRNSRERERNNRDKEKDREQERERRKKGLPDIKKEHLSVCSTTLWVGHLSKLVYQEELSDTFGEYGDIVSIDQIVPRGCAFIVMNRRQDAHKAMQCLKNHKLQGRAITISWAAGKGVKSKEWKDFWDLELGVTYIPWNKLDDSTDFDTLEEGGMFDEDTMPGWMKEKKNQLKNLQEKAKEASIAGISLPGAPSMPPPGSNPLLFNIDTTQPPPGPPPTTGGPPPLMPMVPGQFSMAPPMGAPPRMMGGPHMMPGMPISGIHMPPNIVPPHAAMMMMPGFGMTGQVPPGGGPPPHMGGPHRHPAQFPPPIGNVPPTSAMSSTAANVSSDDQMDIEMEDEDVVPSVEPTPPPGGNNLNFNQPPPAFGGGTNTHENSENRANSMGDNFGRDRSNRGPGSRWGGRGGGVAGGDEEGNEGSGRWRENGGAGGPPHNFGDSGGRNRPDFMNDFDNRGGPRGGGPNFNGGAGGGDFHPNMQNRFNQPTNLMQMRIPPPNAFNQRGGGGPGGPPMFMRGGPGGPGGPGGGGRQQGPGFFNRNNAFDRGGGGGGGVGGGDMGGFGGRGGGRGGRGGGRGGRGGGMGGGRDGGRDWSDEEVEDGFNRRGGVNRFRDRDDSHDRHNIRDRGERGGRGGRGAPGGPRDRNNDRNGRNNRDRENRSETRSEDRSTRSEDRGQSQERSRRISRDDNKKNKRPISDTEEDWDKELEEYVGKNDKKPTASTSSNITPKADAGKEQKENNDRNKEAAEASSTKVQSSIKKHDADEENWDKDDGDNRPKAKSPAPQLQKPKADAGKEQKENKDEENWDEGDTDNRPKAKSPVPQQQKPKETPPTPAAAVVPIPTPSQKPAESDNKVSKENAGAVGEAASFSGNSGADSGGKPNIVEKVAPTVANNDKKTNEVPPAPQPVAEQPKAIAEPTPATATTTTAPTAEAATEA